MKNRIIFNNICLRTTSGYMLFNLVSYRREFISEEQFILINSIFEKLENKEELLVEEDKYYQQLLSIKQILSDDLILQYDKMLEEKNIANFEESIRVLMINLTHDCNFNCIYCYQKNLERKTALNIESVDKLYSLIYENAHLKVDTIVISGGEPLLEKNISLINHILQKFPKEIKFRLFTNGVNILKYWDKIDFKRFCEFQVSLDGDDELIPKVNSYKQPAFEAVTEGVLKAAEAGIKITLQGLITKETLDNCENFAMKLEKKGILRHKNINCSFLGIIDHSKIFTVDDTFYSLEEYLDLRQKIGYKLKPYKIGIAALPEIAMLSSLIFRDFNKMPDIKMTRCGTGKTLVYCPDEKIYWCNCVGSDKGVIGETSQRAFIDNDRINRYTKRSVFTIEKCKNCQFKYICLGGCPLHLSATEKDISTPVCGVFKHPLFLEKLEMFL